MPSQFPPLVRAIPFGDNTLFKYPVQQEVNQLDRYIVKEFAH
jgi:hypothetical protein